MNLLFFVWISKQTEIFHYTRLTVWFYNIDLRLYRPVVTIWTTSLSFNNYTFSPYSEFMYFVWISVQTVIFPYTTSTDWFYNIDSTLYRPVFSIYTKNLTFNNSKFCPHSEFMCFVWISEQTELFPYKTLTDWFYNINLTRYRPVVTICTTRLILKNSTFCPHCDLCVLCGSQNKQRYFLVQL